MIFLKIVTLSCLVFICCQDLLYRAVYWICFPILAILFFVMKASFTGAEEVLKDAWYALIFLTLQLLILSIYFSVKHKKFVNITREYLGWGDVLFLVSLVFYLSPGNYVFFYIASLLLVLFYALLINLTSDKANKHIPLAGLQAALLGMAILVEQIVSNFNLYNDDWIYILINKL